MNMLGLAEWQRIPTFLALVCALVGMSACSESGPTGDSVLPGSAANGDTVAVDLPIPEFIQRAVDPAFVSAELLIDGVPQPVVRTADGFTFTTFLPAGSSPMIDINMYENVGPRRLHLASYGRTLDALNGDVTMDINSNEFNDDPYDLDGDGISNLNERRNDSSPFNINDPGGIVHLRIPFIAPSDAPAIDGLYDRIWNESQFNNAFGDTLAIDNLMIDQGAAPRSDNNTEFRFSAMHDGEFLYLLVLFEDVDGSTPFGDSAEPWQDDNLNLFIDGDDSKLSMYDGVNDFHVFVPFLQSDGTANRSGVPGTRIDAGPNSLPVPEGLRFVNCRCDSGQHIWELRVPIDSLGITIRQPFGFDIQLDEDNDGGPRDARFGWAHPSRIDEDVDNTWRNPSYMGSALLE